MCNFRMWSQSEEDVYVLQCTECNTFQLRLRNAAFLFDPFVFMTFRDMVNDTYRQLGSGDAEDRILIPTFNAGLDLLLHPGQLTELYYLLDAADTEMKAEQMSNLFYQCR